MPNDSPAIAFFDLRLEGRAEWLEAELPVLEKRGFEVIRAGGDCQQLPDGAVLEAGWNSREDWRIQLETIRTEVFSTSVDGEIFLRCARRAVWLAGHAPKADFFYAPGIEESLTVWLAAKLTGRPVALAFEVDKRWNSSVLRTLAKDAARLSDPKKGDELRHGPPVPRRYRIGRISWKRPALPVTAEERQKRLETWLNS